jgi:hypothetical protein
MKHSHYKKTVAGLQFVDVYRVLALFGVTDPCLQHAVKKLLVAGGRGSKDISQDVQEAIDTMQRWQEMRTEDGMAYKLNEVWSGLMGGNRPMPATFGQQNMIDRLKTAADFNDDAPVSMREAVYPDIRPAGICTDCITLSLACGDACMGRPSGD